MNARNKENTKNKENIPHLFVFSKLFILVQLVCQMCFLMIAVSWKEESTSAIKLRRI